MDEQNKASPTWGRYIPGELLERWPRDEEGNPEPPVYLCHCEPLGMAEQLRCRAWNPTEYPVCVNTPKTEILAG